MHINITKTENGFILKKDGKTDLSFTKDDDVKYHVEFSIFIITAKGNKIPVNTDYSGSFEAYDMKMNIYRTDSSRKVITTVYLYESKEETCQNPMSLYVKFGHWNASDYGEQKSMNENEINKLLIKSNDQCNERYKEMTNIVSEIIKTIEEAYCNSNMTAVDLADKISGILKVNLFKRGN